MALLPKQFIGTQYEEKFFGTQRLECGDENTWTSGRVTTCVIDLATL